MFWQQIETNPRFQSLQNLMSGRTQYNTRCLTCKRERLSQEADFHELDLSIEGATSVEQALKNYLAMQHLTGANQYECDVCKSKQDAEQQITVSVPPTVLTLHLLRNGFDSLTKQPVKWSHQVSFPETLTFGGRLFQLTSVAYHIGQRSDGGHFVCDVLDGCTNQWWHCDDQTVFETTTPARTDSSAGDTMVGNTVAGNTVVGNTVAGITAGSRNNSKRKLRVDADEEEDDLVDTDSVDEQRGVEAGKGTNKRFAPTGKKAPTKKQRVEKSTTGSGVEGQGTTGR